MSMTVDPYPLGECYLFGFVNFTPVRMNGMYIVDVTW